MLILFVDDDRDDYEIFCEALKVAKPKVKCRHVSDGLEALEYLNDGNPLPDYIFMDVNMPLMGGEECLRQIKDIPRLKKIPVIMYSTTKNQDEIAAYNRLGAKGFLVKPSTFRKLVDSLNGVIQEN
jgi:CheY-like chemotaxis protein